MSINPTLRCPCGEQATTTVVTYRERPDGETVFDLGDHPYERAYRQCVTCEHFFGEHHMDLSDLYSGGYSDATYTDGLMAAYNRIRQLPPERSDNEARIARILQFVNREASWQDTPKLLDVGSGLAVFPARMSELGWDCTTVDPDPRAVVHAELVSRAVGLCGDFVEISGSLSGDYHLVTLNKVLEHVEDPYLLLEAASHCLRNDGVLYVEVPDGPQAIVESHTREEFFIEHHHVFSSRSLSNLLRNVGFSRILVRSLVEASGKFTLFAFCSE